MNKNLWAIFLCAYLVSQLNCTHSVNIDKTYDNRIIGKWYLQIPSRAHRYATSAYNDSILIYDTLNLNYEGEALRIINEQGFSIWQRTYLISYEWYTTGNDLILNRKSTLTFDHDSLVDYYTDLYNYAGNYDANLKLNYEFNSASELWLWINSFWVPYKKL